MRAYIEVRRECERDHSPGGPDGDNRATMVCARTRTSLAASASAVRTRLAEHIPSLREGARRLGLVTLEQMVEHAGVGG